MPADTITMRAARYFGVEDKPRTSRVLSNTSCLIVTTFSDRPTLLHYEERYGNQHGTFIKFTDKSAAWLIDALAQENRHG